MQIKKTLTQFGLAFTLAVSSLSISAASDTIRIVTDPTFPPMEFTKNGERTGFDIELTEALVAQMGKKIQWTDIDFKGLVPAVISGRADAAVSAIYITDARREVVDFTDSYYAGGLVVITKIDGPIKTLADLDDKRVSVQVGTKSVNFLQNEFPKVKRVEVEKNEEMFNLVTIGRSDAAVTGKPAAKMFAQATPGLTVLDEQITVEEYGIAVSKKQPELTQAFNDALKALKANGTYDKIVDKWFGEAQ